MLCLQELWRENLSAREPGRFFLEKANFHPMLGVLFLSDISRVVSAMAVQSKQFYKCVVEMKAPGKAAQDQVGKAFNFQLLTDKGTQGGGEGE